MQRPIVIHAPADRIEPFLDATLFCIVALGGGARQRRLQAFVETLPFEYEVLSFPDKVSERPQALRDPGGRLC
jgi:hypothetical protein